MLERQHRDELHASGLSGETIEASGIFSDDGKRIREILGDPPKSLRGWGSGMVIPFRSCGKIEPDFWRVKLDHPRTNGKGRTLKYEQPRGQGNRVYFPPGFEESLTNGKPILLTEGEKKSLSGQQAGWPTIGITGVWNFQLARRKTDTGRKYGQRKLIPDLLDIPWKDRQVVIVYDSDAATNDLVRMAEAKLADLLSEQGATTLVARFPRDGDQKVGLDDFIVNHGVEALQQVIREAEPAEVPPLPNCLDAAAMIVDEEFTSPAGVTLRWYHDEFFAFHDTKYVPIPESELQNSTILWLDKRGLKATPRFAADVVKCLAALVRIPFDVGFPAFLDGRIGSPSHTVAFRNGLLDLTDLGGDFRLHPHSPQWFSTSCLPYDFDQHATCESFVGFLKEVLRDEDRILLLQEWFGLCLTHDTSFQKLLMMVGPKRSGKGTVLRILQYVIGVDNCASPSLGSLASEFGLWQLIGKSVAMFPDAHLGHRADSVRVLETIKSVVGEDSVSINRKNLPYLCNTRLRTRFIITVNELPRFSDASDAFGARLCLLPFDTSFADRMDRGLEAALKMEAAGILLWAFCGLRRLKEQDGFTEPLASVELLANYRRVVSPVTGFVEDWCETGPGLNGSCDDLYAAWCSWCSDNGHNSGSKSTFGTHLSAAFPNIRRFRRRLNSGGREYFYEGMALNALGSIAVGGKTN